MDSGLLGVVPFDDATEAALRAGARALRARAVVASRLADSAERRGADVLATTLREHAAHFDESAETLLRLLSCGPTYAAPPSIAPPSR